MYGNGFIELGLQQIKQLLTHTHTLIDTHTHTYMVLLKLFNVADDIEKTLTCVKGKKLGICY